MISLHPQCAHARKPLSPRAARCNALLRAGDAALNARKGTADRSATDATGMQGESFPLPVGDMTQAYMKTPPAGREMISLHPQCANPRKPLSPRATRCTALLRAGDAALNARKGIADRSPTGATGGAGGIIPLARRRHYISIHKDASGGQGDDLPAPSMREPAETAFPACGALCCLAPCR
ncbi:hypothetical protein RDSD_000058 [Oleidesulfovibrio alaskensis]